MVHKHENQLLVIAKTLTTRLYFQVVTRLFTLPSLFIILSLYVFTIHNVHTLYWFDDGTNWSLFGQSANYLFGDKNFYTAEIPELWLSLIALLALVESTVYKLFYENRISFPRFLYAYKSLLVMTIPVWSVLISIVFLNTKALWMIPITAILLVFIWPLLNAEYALYIIAEKYLTNRKIEERNVNQKARAPWVAMKDLWTRKLRKA